MYWSKPQPPKDTSEVRNAVQHTVDEGHYTFYIPLRVGMALGLATTVLLLILFVAVQIQWYPGGLWPIIWFMAPLSGVVVFVIVFWLIGKKGWSVIETVTRRDLNGDGYIGRTPEPPDPVRVESKRENGESNFDLPFYDKLKKYARAIGNGVDNTQSTWTGKGRLFSRPQYEALVNAMIDKGMGQWVDPNNHDQGWEWTGEGLRIMEELARR